MRVVKKKNHMCNWEKRAVKGRGEQKQLWHGQQRASYRRKMREIPQRGKRNCTIFEESKEESSILRRNTLRGKKTRMLSSQGERRRKKERGSTTSTKESEPSETRQGNVRKQPLKERRGGARSPDFAKKKKENTSLTMRRKKSRENIQTWHLVGKRRGGRETPGRDSSPHHKRGKIELQLALPRGREHWLLRW